MERLERRRNRRLNALMPDFNRRVETMDLLDRLMSVLPTSAVERIKCVYEKEGRTAANRELCQKIRHRDNWYESLVTSLKECEGYGDLVEALRKDKEGSLVPGHDILSPQSTVDPPMSRNVIPITPWIKKAEDEQVHQYEKSSRSPQPRPPGRIPMSLNQQEKLDLTEKVTGRGKGPLAINSSSGERDRRNGKEMEIRDENIMVEENTKYEKHLEELTTHNANTDYHPTSVASDKQVPDQEFKMEGSGGGHVRETDIRELERSTTYGGLYSDQLGSKKVQGAEEKSKIHNNPRENKNSRENENDGIGFNEPKFPLSEKESQFFTYNSNEKDIDGGDDKPPPIKSDQKVTCDQFGKAPTVPVSTSLIKYDDKLVKNDSNKMGARDRSEGKVLDADCVLPLRRSTNIEKDDIDIDNPRGAVGGSNHGNEPLDVKNQGGLEQSIDAKCDVLPLIAQRKVDIDRQSQSSGTVNDQVDSAQRYPENNGQNNGGDDNVIRSEDDGRFFSQNENEKCYTAEGPIQKEILEELGILDKDGNRNIDLNQLKGSIGDRDKWTSLISNESEVSEPHIEESLPSNSEDQFVLSTTLPINHNKSKTITTVDEYTHAVDRAHKVPNQNEEHGFVGQDDVLAQGKVLTISEIKTGKNGGLEVDESGEREHDVVCKKVFEEQSCVKGENGVRENRAGEVGTACQVNQNDVDGKERERFGLVDNHDTSAGSDKQYHSKPNVCKAESLLGETGPAGGNESNDAILRQETQVGDESKVIVKKECLEEPMVLTGAQLDMREQNVDDGCSGDGVQDGKFKENGNGDYSATMFQNDNKEEEASMGNVRLLSSVAGRIGSTILSMASNYYRDCSG